MFLSSVRLPVAPFAGKEMLGHDVVDLAIRLSASSSVVVLRQFALQKRT